MQSIGIGEVLIVLFILFFCLFLPALIFIVARGLIRKGKRIVKTAPDQLQRSVLQGLEKLDQRFPNDPREAARWSSGNDVLDLDPVAGPAEMTDYDAHAAADPLPDSHAPAQAYCSACGAPLKNNSRKCEFCGQAS